MTAFSDEARQNAVARFWASATTWPVEKSKLIYQGRRQNNAQQTTSVPSMEKVTNENSWKRDRQHQTQSSSLSQVRYVTQRFVSLPLKHHVLGVTSSGLQRGGSAFLMFYAQSHVYEVTTGMTGYACSDHAVAGALSGLLSAPFHTYWELIKVRGTIPNALSCYFICLGPMLLRHGVFDGTFFGVNSYLLDQQRQDNSNLPKSSGFRFAMAAASASFTNLWFDIWKTLQMKLYPKRMRLYRGVMIPMHWMTRSFWSNYLVKGTDLTVNWFAVGCLKDYLFPSKLVECEG